MSQDVLEDYADTFRIRKAASKGTRSYQFLQVTALRAGRNINMMPPLGCTMLTNHFIIIPLGLRRVCIRLRRGSIALRLCSIDCSLGPTVSFGILTASS
jgi:hypothetical protein